MNWTYRIVRRPDGKFRLLKKGVQDSRYDTDHGDYADLALAQAAMERMIQPQIFYYDESGNKLDDGEEKL